jgi:hypothetical protein
MWSGDRPASGVLMRSRDVRGASSRSRVESLYTLAKNGENCCLIRQRLRTQKLVSSRHRKNVTTNKMQEASTRPTRTPLGRRPSGCAPFDSPGRPLRRVLRYRKGRLEKGHLARKLRRPAELCGPVWAACSASWRSGSTLWAVHVVDESQDPVIVAGGPLRLELRKQITIG